MIKEIAWDTFKKTGDINAFLEFKQITDEEEKLQKNMENFQKTNDFRNIENVKNTNNFRNIENAKNNNSKNIEKF